MLTVTTQLHQGVGLPVVPDEFIPQFIIYATVAFLLFIIIFYIVYKFYLSKKLPFWATALIFIIILGSIIFIGLIAYVSYMLIYYYN